ncbi:peptide-methionine (R)-S-oxide reductase [Thermobifida halotolerans]
MSVFTAASRGSHRRSAERGSVISMNDSNTPVNRSEEEWRAVLDPEAFAVLRQGATERPWSGEYVSTKTQGVYRCRACGAELFRSEHKFDSHCGWPSFYDPAESSAVTLHEDHSLGMVRTEVRCARCGSHLGHVFHGEGYPTPTDDRYCINSVALTLEAEDTVE